MNYYQRILLASLLLALSLFALAALFDSGGEVLVVDQGPVGSGVALDATIQIRFSRPVDRRSAEASFLIVPPVPGRLSWQAEVLFFTPSQPFAAATNYRVIIRPGLRDSRGRVNRSETQWTFRTR
jgi:hypothetical protein